MKPLLRSFACLAAIFIAGCQMPGKTISETDACPACPKCKSTTTTGIIKGTTVTSVFCPGCKCEHTDQRLLEYMPPEKFVFCCEKCKINVKRCADCAICNQST